MKSTFLCTSLFQLDISIIDNAVQLFLIISRLQLYITFKSDAALLRRLPNLSVPMLFLRNKGEST